MPRFDSRQDSNAEFRQTSGNVFTLLPPSARSDAWQRYPGLKEAAGLESVVDYPDPQCERCWNPDQEGHGWLTVINHRREAVEAGLTSSRRILAVSRIAGEAEITGTRIRLEPLQAAIFEVSLGA